MKRYPDWDRRLMKTVEAAAERPFSWGRHDCCLFAADCVAAVTGRDVMRAYRGTYSNRAGAQRALRQLGCKTLYHTMLSLFGRPVGPARAGRGDVAYHVFPDGPALGICLGQHTAFVGTDTVRNGLITLSTSTIERFFRTDHGKST